MKYSAESVRSLGLVFRPIPMDSVAAATELRSDHMLDWSASARALYSLPTLLPENDEDSVLCRVAAVNSLYNAGVSDQNAMARHLCELTGAGALADASVGAAEIVRRIATLPGRLNDAPGCLVFASKYAHFVLDPDLYPIYDQHAARALMRHYGKLCNETLVGRDRYTRFHEMYEVVRAHSREIASVSHGDLDAYLWLSGVYREWRRMRAGESYHAIARSSVKFFADHFGTGDPVDVLLFHLTPGDWFFEALSEA